jgi:hypothetical protein
MSYSQQFVLLSRCSAHFNHVRIHLNSIQPNRWTATIHRPAAKKDRSPDAAFATPWLHRPVDREDQALCTRVCEGTATILSIFVLQGSPAGHQLTAAYDG